MESRRANLIQRLPFTGVLMLTALLTLDGCSAIEGIFKAGFAIGIIVVVGMVALVGMIVAFARK